LFKDPRIVRFATLSYTFFFIDQVSKFLARFFLQSKTVDLGILKLQLVYNTGAAYGILSGQTLFLLILGIVAIVYLIWNIKQFITTKIELVAYSLLMAGALGNTFDRLLFSKVTDFINIMIIPVFNVADVLLNIGIILVFYKWLVYDRRKLR
jgi:signal peptidase II